MLAENIILLPGIYGEKEEGGMQVRDPYSRTIRAHNVEYTNDQAQTGERRYFGGGM